MTPPTLDDIRDAAARLRRQAVRTPLLENPFLSERAGGRVFVKPENLQVTGSFGSAMSTFGVPMPPPIHISHVPFWPSLVHSMVVLTDPTEVPST